MVCRHPPRFVIKRGFRRNKSGKVQIFMCTKCYVYFSIGPRKFFDNNLKKRVVSYCKWRYKKGGVSLNDLKRIIKEKFGVKRSDVAIMKWLRKDGIL